MISVSIFILWAHRAATFLQIQDSEPWDAYYETPFFSESSSSDTSRIWWSMGSILGTLPSAEGKGGKPAWLLRNCFSAAPLLKVRGCFFHRWDTGYPCWWAAASQRTGGNEAGLLTGIMGHHRPGHPGRQLLQLFHNSFRLHTQAVTSPKVSPEHLCIWGSHSLGCLRYPPQTR